MGDEHQNDQEESQHHLTVTDSRTGKSIKIPVHNNGFIHAPDLRQIGITSFDPGFMNTAAGRSRICHIDGEKGKLLYRGYAIEELAEKSSFLEVAYLLIYGALPVKAELENWQKRIMTHTYLHENLVQLMKSFRYDSHPMGMLISTIAAMSTFHPEGNPSLRGTQIYENFEVQNKQIFRLIGKLPTIAACAYRHRIGRPYNNPVNYLNYTENFLYMLDRLSEHDYRPNPALARALDVLFIIHAEHEFNCSTAAMRHLSSSGVDPYTAVAGAAAALYGPSHGGASEAVVRMLEDIGTVEKIDEFLADVKAKRKRLMGFGHRVYKNYDPRAKILKAHADRVFSILGTDELMKVAVELETRALSDEYFISRRLYPNVDFYSGLIYRTMGFPVDMFPVLFTIPRTVGWLAHWREMLQNGDTRIWRPRQMYEGETERAYSSIYDRQSSEDISLKAYESKTSRRRMAAHS